jgi:hypothetical protein
MRDPPIDLPSRCRNLSPCEHPAWTCASPLGTSKHRLVELRRITVENALEVTNRKGLRTATTNRSARDASSKVTQTVRSASAHR